MESDTSPEISTIWNEAKEHIEQGNYDKAIEIYKYVLIRYSDDDIAVEYANAYLGDIYLTLRQLNLAEKHIKKAIKYKPDNAGYHYILGFIYSVQSQWSKAIHEFEIAVAKEPNNSEYLRGLGWSIHCAGNKEKGSAYLLKAHKLAPTSINILTDLAAAYLTDLQFNKARQYAERAIRIAPNNTMAREVLEKINSFQTHYKRLVDGR
jgi:tetratricopeptide (TPR) repeat protein